MGAIDASVAENTNQAHALSLTNGALGPVNLSSGMPNNAGSITSFALEIGKLVGIGLAVFLLWRLFTKSGKRR